MSQCRPIGAVLGFAFALAGAAANANTTMHEYVTLDRTDYVNVAVGGIGAPVAQGGGAGTLTLAGVSGTVTLALLYWNGIDVEMPEIGLTGGDSDYDEPEIEFDGVDISGTRVAVSGSNDCWPQIPQLPSAATFRADVTDRIAARGNGDYDFVGLADKPGHSANGVSLIVYFDDHNPANDLRITHYEGLQSNTEEMRFEPWVDYDGGVVEAVLHVSDGQDLLSDGPMYWSAPAPIPGLPAIELRYTALYDGLPLWPGTSVPRMDHGRDPIGAQGLWDIRHVPLTPLFGPAKRYATKIRHSLSVDCISLQVAQIVQPADPKPAMLSPNPVDFGDVVVGTTTPPRRITLTNLMPDPIELGTPEIGNSQFLIVAQTCDGQTLAPAATCTIDVTYTPSTVLAPHDYPLIVPFNDSLQASAAVDVFALMRGAGVPDAPFSRVEFDQQQCEYPDARVGSGTGAVHFTASNTGTLPITITELEVDADFPLHRAGCLVDGVLAPGQACSVDVGFRPVATGRRTSPLLLQFEAEDAAQGYARSDLGGHGLAAGETIHADGFEAVICSPW